VDVDDDDNPRGVRSGWVAKCSFEVDNDGEAGDVSGTQPDDVQSMVDGDVFRLDASATRGWEVWMPREVIAIENGDDARAEVYVGRVPGARSSTEVTLSVTSESDPQVSEDAECDVHVRDTRR
jgi:hypothetical protein